MISGYRQFFIVFAILALAAFPARADYHYASHEGSDEYPYTSWEMAADSIQKAMDASSPHDTLYIGAGEWYEATATGVYDSIAIIGMGIDSTFCYTDEYRVPVMTIDYGCSVEGITFQHLGDWKCIWARTYAGVKIGNCRFENSSIGINASGGVTEIQNCIFDSCGIAIFLPIWAGDFLIRNNLILNSYDDQAILLYVHSAVVQNNIIINSDGVDVSGIRSGLLPGEVIIQNNVVMNGFHGIGVDSWLIRNNSVKNFDFDEVLSGGIHNSGLPDTANTISNNSASECYSGIGVSPGMNVSYNNLWSNEIDISNPEGYPFDSVGNIYQYPMFLMETDLHLQAFSLLIDAGDPDLLDPDGTRSDIGAYGGPYGESYEYLDLPPEIPDSLSAMVSYEDSTIYLNWRYNFEGDFDRYQLHRGEEPGFEPSIFNMIAEPETSYFEDTDWVFGQDYYYRIAAVDNQDNISDYSEELAVIQTGVEDFEGAELPSITKIQQNYPNPFNSQTMITYTVANLGPIPAKVEIDIYDVLGRRVRKLVDAQLSVGTHRAVWDGKDDYGNDCPSGIYFARISQWGLSLDSRPVKLVLIR